MIDLTPTRSRISSVDVVRGAVMVLMALDHVRDYVTNLRFQPEDLSRGTAALFATRWVTHFCAPAFFLLAGIRIGLSANRGATPRDLSRYLIARGLWLLVLELVITPIGWQFGFTLVPAFALVLWALGWSMMAMALLVHLPRALVAVLSVVVIAGHNLFDGVGPESFGALAPLWTALHVPGFVIPGALFVGYPLVPWFAVMALGYVLAGAFTWKDASRRTLFLTTGLAAVALFIVLRGMNGYGNTFEWSVQRTPALTVASFLNVRKYPPSLMFLLMTLGPVLRTRAAVLLRGSHRGRPFRRHAAGARAEWRVAPRSHHPRPRGCAGIVRSRARRGLHRVDDRGSPDVLPLP
jgi:uncharacterized membrane protein